MSGAFVPMCKTYGKFFTDKGEPETWDVNFRNMYKNYFNKENLPIYRLNYFYNKEKKSRKKLVRLDDIEDFINSDPYIGTKESIEDPYKQKIKRVKIKHLEKEGLPSVPFIDNTKKKTNRKKKRKKKDEEEIRKIKVRRIKQK